MLLEAKQLSKSYHLDGQQIHVLHNLGMSVAAGEFLAVNGQSGSGKTTLLSLLSGLDHPSTGQVLIDKTDITRLSEKAMASFRNTTIGFVFQSFHLVPSLTTIENVMLPAELNQDRQARPKAEALLAKVGLSGRQNSYPQQLSGGEKQRTAICRALINQPRIIFADEPTGNLDSTNSKTVLNLLLELQAEYQTTLVLATHSKALTQRAQRVLTLVDGQITM
jgi:putative ABC transport system ATP-binding protein